MDGRCFRGYKTQRLLIGGTYPEGQQTQGGDSGSKPIRGQGDSGAGLHGPEQRRRSRGWVGRPQLRKPGDSEATSCVLMPQFPF